MFAGTPTFVCLQLTLVTLRALIDRCGSTTHDLVFLIHSILLGEMFLHGPLWLWPFSLRRAKILDTKWMLSPFVFGCFAIESIPQIMSELFASRIYVQMLTNVGCPGGLISAIFI